MAIEFNGHLPALRKAFKNGDITFYLGAGVSKPNGLPSWEELVQALYFSTLGNESGISQLRPYPNYLFALAEWVLKQKNEPLDIIIRKIKQWYEGKDFIGMMRSTLYAGLGSDTFGDYIGGLPEMLLEKNKTLAEIINCCRKSAPEKKGIRSIITYNYDNLVEMSLEAGKTTKNKFQVIYKKDHRLEKGKIPIYHVHGYIPYQYVNVNYDDIIFSEEQYNRAFQDQFFWGNVVQVNHLTNSTGLMIGLSLSDRNTRRILDSIRDQPLPNDNYILLRRPQFKPLEIPGRDYTDIREKAEKYLDRFPLSRMKMPEKEPSQIQQILNGIYQYELEEFHSGFENLGLNVITFDEFTEIQLILQQIASA